MGGVVGLGRVPVAHSNATPSKASVVVAPASLKAVTAAVCADKVELGECTYLPVRPTHTRQHTEATITAAPLATPVCGVTVNETLL